MILIISSIERKVYVSNLFSKKSKWIETKFKNKYLNKLTPFKIWIEEKLLLQDVESNDIQSASIKLSKRWLYVSNASLEITKKIKMKLFVVFLWNVTKNSLELIDRIKTSILKGLIQKVFIIQFIYNSTSLN